MIVVRGESATRGDAVLRNSRSSRNPQQEITHAPTTPEIDDQYIEVGSMLNIAST